MHDLQSYEKGDSQKLFFLPEVEVISYKFRTSNVLKVYTGRDMTEFQPSCG